MKNVKWIMVFLAIGLFGIGFTSCGNSGKKTDADKQGKEYTSTYICPMHCDGSGSDDPGKCPVCGMDYVLNEDHKEDGHDHDHNHDGHDH